MAKFFYEIRVKKQNKLVAQYVFSGLRDAYKKAVATVQHLSGCNVEDVKAEEGQLWLKAFSCGGVYAFVYRNMDGHNILPSADDIATEAERGDL